MTSAYIRLPHTWQSEPVFIDTLQPVDILIKFNNNSIRYRWVEHIFMMVLFYEMISLESFLIKLFGTGLIKDLDQL